MKGIQRGAGGIFVFHRGMWLLPSMLDASIALTWCFPDEDAANAQHALNLLHEASARRVTQCMPCRVAAPREPLGGAANRAAVDA